MELPEFRLSIAVGLKPCAQSEAYLDRGLGLNDSMAILEGCGFLGDKTQLEGWDQPPFRSCHCLTPVTSWLACGEVRCCEGKKELAAGGAVWRGGQRFLVGQQTVTGGKQVPAAAYICRLDASQVSTKSGWQGTRLGASSSSSSAFASVVHLNACMPGSSMALWVKPPLPHFSGWLCRSSMQCTIPV